jgi:hypothetical protein
VSSEPTLLALSASKPGDGDGSRLDRALRAVSAFERARALRVGLIHLLAALSVPVWLTAAWPGSFSLDLRRAATGAFAVALGLVVAAAARERWWQRRRSLDIAQLGPARLRAEAAQACARPRDQES